MLMTSKGFPQAGQGLIFLALRVARSLCSVSSASKRPCQRFGFSSCSALSKKSLREDYITTQGLIILALGRLGEFYCVNPQINMAKSLKGLKKIDWLRNNEACWMNRAIKPNGKINRNEQGIFLTYIQIKRLLSLPVSDEETKKERIIMG